MAASASSQSSFSQQQQVFVPVVGVDAGCNRPSTDWSGIVCCLKVPNCLLLRWYEGRGSGTSYVEQLNEAIRDQVITVDVHCKRLEEHLQRRARATARNLATCSGGSRRKKILANSTTVDIYEGETIRASHLFEELNMLSEDIQQWISRCSGAEATVAQLKREIRSFARSDNSPLNIGHELNELSSRQRRRKLSQLKSSTESALWFVNSFGLELESVSLHDSSTGTPVTLTYSQSSSTTPLEPYSEPTVEALHQTLYLLERFGVSDDFFHELSMVHPSLPRSYRVKQTRKTLSEGVTIKKLQSPYRGAFRPFRDCLSAAIAHEV